MTNTPTPTPGPRELSERDQARLIAERFLDRSGVDPDDDVGVLARQFIRTIQRVSQADALFFEAGYKACERGDNLLAGLMSVGLA